MNRHLSLAAGLAALLGGAVWAVDRAAQAETKAQRGETASRRVRAALRQELYGNNADRTALLEMALEAVPEFAPALWHSGHVRLHNTWVRFDQSAGQTARDRRSVAYRIRRAKCPDTVQGHLALAKWCVGQKLADQARAHLTRVIELAPDHVEARGLLGFRRVDGQWLSGEEIAQSARRARDAAKALAEWKPRIEKIRDGLDHRGLAQRKSAAQRLLAVDDPAAIGAMEALLGGHSELTAQLTVEALSRMSASEASLALARQAVFSRWESVRKSAAESLGSRDRHSFVPALLAAMSTQIRSRMELYEAPGGRMTYRHVFFRQEQDRDAVTVLQTGYRHQDPAIRALSNPDRRDIAEDALAKARAREMELARQNAVIGQFNQRICEVLAVATGQGYASPEEWWRWWNDYNEVYVVGPRPVARVYQEDEVLLIDPSAPETAPSEGQTSGGVVARVPSTYECLVAGTPVWTDSGPMPVEQIRVGDRVLSQDPETGQLAYKPVLRTTTRPAGPLIRIQAGEDAIQASGGHPFWVSGKGWIKARNLKPRHQLHGATGTAQVDSVVQTGFQKTYNLIVADFHTYFVGPARILSHDNTIRKPTDILVPGLARRD